MKFDNSTLVLKMTARQVTRANQAWAVDHAVLDLAERPLVRLVVDVGTRLPLSATLTLAVDDDIAAELDRLAPRSGRPKQIWLDNKFEFRSDPALRSWTEQHRISIIYVPMVFPQMKVLSERSFRDLGAFLKDTHPPTLRELSHDLERWRKSYAAGARTIPTSTT
jgi:hypothetical protein